MFARMFGSGLIAIGCLALGLDVAQDHVVARLPFAGQHGIYGSDVLGIAVVLGGIVLLWRAPERG
jgi:hypothetical protein